MPSKKALEKALQKEKEIQEMEKKQQEDASWEVGTNKRGKMREQKINEKQEQKMKRDQEMKELISIDEALNTKEPRPKTRRNKRGDLDLLNEALANAPKSRAQKEAEEKMREKEARKFEELRRQKEQERLLKEQEAEDYMLKQRNIQRQEKLTIEVNNLEPIYEEDSIYATGIDEAIDCFGEEPAKNKKALYKEFYERNLPILKTELPGLRLSQYEDKIHKMWKISFDNPNNN